MRRYGSSNEDQILVRFEDISDQLAAEISIREKNAAILELSTPITKIWDEILVLPMIGTLDAERANKMIEQLLMPSAVNGPDQLSWTGQESPTSTRWWQLISSRQPRQSNFWAPRLS